MQSDRGSSPTSRTAIHVGTPHQSPPPCKLKKQPPSCDDFGVAFICALPIEAAAIIALFDEQWDYGALDKADTDTNQYSLGSIAECCVVLAHMPGMGKVAAATVAGNLRSSFRYLKLILVVGICGGVPKAPSKAWDELLLGDVVVSTGLVQYDFGRQLPNRFVRKDTVEDNLSRLSVEAGCILAKLRTEQAREGLCRSMSRHLGTIQNRLGAKVAYPGRSNDMLFRSDYLHKHHKVGQCSVCAGDVAAVCDQAFERSCEELGCGHLPSDLIPRLRPEHELDPVVHFGLFGSGDTVMRSGTDRDEIADRNGILAFEMEGAGLWEMLRVSSCLIVKSVCDYSDSHKNKSFQGYAAAVAAATAKALLQCWTACMPKSLQARHPSRRPPRNRRPPLTAGEIRVLNRLKTLPYSDRKDRNPRRVPGTCEWFVRHKLFRGWLEGVDSQSSALWASADPGCGKSVLARYLVDNVLPTSETRTTCYFFFKDDFEDQKSVVDALKCILHQLFTQKPVLFSDAIRAQIEAEEDKLALSFRDLWDILLRAADTEDAGEVLCIFDALDECGLEDRSKLTAALIDLRHTKKAPNLKFLLTSRPYGTIRRSFQLPDAPDLAVIHLSGEDEAEIEQISREIDIFIKARVQGIGARLMLGEERQELLLRSLLNVPHRTYLWVYLTLSLVESDENITKGKIRQTTSLLPRSVDEAYEKILSASRDPDEARRALHIIVAAKTPLTLGEMNFALTLRSSHRSYHDVDLTSDGWFRERLRDICGLFVTVINSKIYLLHQTAKEFLVKPDREEERILKLRWKHSLDPSESHRILGEICLWNLQFPELHKHMDIGFWDIRDCVRHYQFLEYSTVAWASHLLAQDVKIDKLLIEAILDLYRRCDRHCPFWFQLIAAEAPANTVYGVTLPTIADDPDRTLLMIASFFGLAPVVEALIKTGGGGGLLARDSQGRTALTWAVMYGHHDAARILIESQPGVLRGLSWLGLWKPAIVEAANNKGETPLIHAVLGVSESLTRLLLDKGANIEARDVRGATALWHAAGE
ncbi:purine and uridine phosphorylase, partial [Parathielavia appendiculata]